ncbi:hypothetical protein OPT61_g1555 [Boeremia exigua]|uniref:Uncharacterized protein n=1 Tax=Boeremia exigua TaxID=749465 RepID=A0ACC2IPY4_9PLEO|nr:hypothetical protein OPT61_g1555 [Boeremia exigua]
MEDVIFLSSRCVSKHEGSEFFHAANNIERESDSAGGRNSYCNRPNNHNVFEVQNEHQTNASNQKGENHKKHKVIETHRSTRCLTLQLETIAEEDEKQTKHSIERFSKRNLRKGSKLNPVLHGGDTSKTNERPIPSRNKPQNAELGFERTHAAQAQELQRRKSKARDLAAHNAILTTYLAAQKQMHEQASQSMQRLEAEVAATKLANHALERNNTNNSSIIKQLLRTKHELEAQVRQRDTQILALNARRTTKKHRVTKREAGGLKEALKQAEARIERLGEHYDGLHTKNLVMWGKLKGMAEAGGFGHRNSNYKKDLDALKAPALDELGDL